MSPLSTPESHAADQLLLVLDPVARQTDGESVRIAKDVLSGRADVRVAMPESPSELDRVLARRSRRLPVVIGDDQAVQRVLQALYRRRELGAEPIGVVPVGRPGQVAAARALGVPDEPVAAARAVINGAPRKLDLLLDDRGGVVLGGVRISGRTHGMADWSGGWRSLWAKLAAPEQASPPDHTRLRVEADGRLLTDVHQPLRLLEAMLHHGKVEVLLHGGDNLVQVRAESVSVTGRGFGYEADGCPAGPVRARTWTVHAGAWQLVLPALPTQGG